MFKTTLQRWVLLAVFSLVNSVASGPMTMWPALEPILIKEKVFEGPSQLDQLSAVYSLAIGVIMTSMLPIGIVYDSYGPRWIAVVGTLAFAAFSVGIGISLKFENLNWLLYCFYPLGLMCGYGKSYGAYGYQWLLPDSQNTVNSLISATQALSDALVLVCVWAYHTYGMQLWTYFWSLALLSLLTAALNNVIVPSRKEHFGYAAAVTNFMQATGLGQGYGSDNSCDAEEARVPIRSSGWRWWDNVKGVYETFRNYPVEHFLFTAGCCTFYMFYWYPCMQMYPFYLGMFGATEATILVDYFAIIYGILGAVATVLAGRLVDRIGLKLSMAAFNLLTIVAYIAILIPTVQSQLVFQVCLSILLSGYTVFVYRFCMLYGPVQLFGSYTGVMMFIMGLFQMGCSAATALLKSHVAVYTKIDQGHLEVLFVRGLTSGFAVVSIALWSSLLVYWQWFPHPAAGSISCHQAGIPEESEYQALDEMSLSEDGDSWF